MEIEINTNRTTGRDKDNYESEADKQFEQIASQEIDTSRISHDTETNQDIALDDIPF